MDKHRLSLIVIGILAVAIVAGGWFVGIQPQLDRMSTANSQTQSIAQLNDVQQLAIDALAAENEHLDQYKADLSEEHKRIPASRSQQELINQIDAAATAAGVTVRTLRFDAATEYVAPEGVDVTPPSSGRLVAIPMTLTADGDRAQLEAFVGSLQQSDRIVTISGSRYSSGDVDSIELTGTTWVLSPTA